MTGRSQFIPRFDWQYPSVFDPDGEIRDRLSYLGQPITVIHDRRGDLAFEWTGAVTAALLQAEIGRSWTADPDLGAPRWCPSGSRAR
jgi:hypothetical protein